MKRRPSFATGIALLALFVALGGPAEAQSLLGKGDVNSRVVKDRSLKTRDLSRRAVRDLRATPNGSITEAKIANGSITAGKLATGAVGSAVIADRSVGPIDLAAGAVGSAQLADRSLGAADIARYLGALRAPGGGRPWTDEEIGVNANSCWAGDPGNLWPEREGADISGDLVIVNPDDRWPSRVAVADGPQLGTEPVHARRLQPDGRLVVPTTLSRLPLPGHRPAVATRSSRLSRRRPTTPRP